MSNLKSHKRALVVALEGNTPGTYTPPDVPILWGNMDVKPLEQTVVKREVAVPDYDQLAALMTGGHGVLDFEVELVPSRQNGIAPPWEPLLLACGFAQTTRPAIGGTLSAGDATHVGASNLNNADGHLTGRFIRVNNGAPRMIVGHDGNGTKIWPPLSPAAAPTQSFTVLSDTIYTPVSDFESDYSLSMDYYKGTEGGDALLHKFRMGRGKPQIMIAAGKPTKLKLSFTALLEGREDTAMPDLDYSDWNPPLIPSEDNLPVVSLHGYRALVLESLSIDLQIKSDYRQRCNQETVDYQGREPKASIQYEALLLADHDYYTACEQGTEGELLVQLGHQPYGLIGLRAPRAQVLTATDKDTRGILDVSADLQLNRKVGNDSIMLICA